MYYETITEKIREIAPIIYHKLDKRYYLAGGTALALQIGHRKSLDLDYFIQDHIDIQKLKNSINEMFSGRDIHFVFEEKDTLWCIIDTVKVSFISRFDPLIDDIRLEKDFRLASLKDITVMKLSAISSREEYKDYFDLACLTTFTDVRSWISWWQKAYPKSDPISFMVALSAVEQVKPVALDINEKFKSIQIMETLKKAILEIKEFFNS